jgi:two-component system chemotaxis response regulator CheB
MTGPRIQVLLVDDSAVVRQALTGILARDPSLNVMAAASDPLFAMRHMEKSWPDVIVLDVEMPRMDGITFLRKIMAEHPTPVVICSSLTEAGAETTLQALSAGAVEIITKPRLGARRFIEDEAATLIQAVKSAARVRMDRLLPNVCRPSSRIPAEMAPATLTDTTEKVIAIGTSTGGTQALECVLSALPRVVPGIVIVQHMPEKFTSAFAQRLDGLCAIEVREATNGERVRPGLALIAPGGRHMALGRSGAQYHVLVKDGPLVNRHRPSVDVLFRSTARIAGHNALGIIMTGMGDDGAEGILEMHLAGAQTIAQDEDSCVVYGMPKEAVKRGAIDRVRSLDDIPEEICRFARSAYERRALAG